MVTGNVMLPVTAHVFTNLSKISRQRVLIDPMGGIVTLEYKPRKGADVKALGTADVKRSTDILWSPEGGYWFVKWLDFGLEGTCLLNSQYLKALSNLDIAAIPVKPLDITLEGAVTIHLQKDGDSVTRVHVRNMDLDAIARFATYDDAIAAEIDTIEGLKLTNKKLDS